MADFILGTLIDGFFGLYIIFSVSEFKSGKRLKGILFWVLICGLGTVAMQYCLHNNWMAGGVSVGRIVKYFYMVIMFLFGSQFLRGGITRTVIIILICDLVSTSAEMLESALCFGLIHRSLNGFYIMDWSEHSILQGILLLCCHVVLCILLTGLYHKIRTVSFEQSWIAKIVAIAYVVIGFNPALDSLFMVGRNKKGFLLLCLVYVAVVFGFTALLLSERNRIYQQKNLHLFLREQMMKEYVRLMEDQITVTRKFRHDIRKHLDMVSYIAKRNPEYETSQQLREYRQDLSSVYRSLSRGDYCSEADVNAILYQLEKFCKRNGTSFEVKLKDMNCSFMQPEERSGLFFCTVNWTMEVCKAYAEREQRFCVMLSGETAAGRSVLAVEIGSDGGEISMSENLWLKQLEKSLAGYDGFCEVRQEPGRCRLAISWAVK